MISPRRPFALRPYSPHTTGTAHATQGTTRSTAGVLLQGGLEEGGTTSAKGGGFRGQAQGLDWHFNHPMSGTAQHQDPGKAMVEEGKKKRRKEKEVGEAKSAAAAAAALLQSSDLLIAEFDALNSD